MLNHLLCCIPKILKNESNSQHAKKEIIIQKGCVVSQRYLKMKAIHNKENDITIEFRVVLYPKDT